MLRELSAAEMRVAKEMTKCGGREYVADKLCLSVETVRTHLKNIYLKLNIHNEMELLMVVVGDALGKRFSAKELREKGMSVMLSVLFLVMGCTNATPDDMRRMPRRSGRRIETVIDGGMDNGDE